LSGERADSQAWIAIVQLFEHRKTAEPASATVAAIVRNGE
jgi:hypothetical protein